MKERITNTNSEKIEITALESVTDEDLIDGSAPELIERASKRPGYIEDDALTSHLDKIVSMGYTRGLGLDPSTRYSEHDDEIRAHLHQTMLFNGVPLYETTHFVTVYDVYAGAVLRALQQNRASQANRQTSELLLAP